MNKVEFDTIAWETPAEFVRCKAIEQDGKRMRILEITREFVEPGWCTKGHVLYLLEGRLELEFVDRTLELALGDGCFITAGEAMKHKPKALTETARMLLVEDVSSSEDV